MSCSFTSHGLRGNRVGECWYKEGSEDGHIEIFINPDKADSLVVAEILIHELCHAALGNGFGHGPEFKKLATAMKLAGPMKATVPTEEFNSWAKGIIDKIGEYPHASLKGAITAHNPRTQKKVPHKNMTCPTCGFHAKVLVSQISFGRLICPADGEKLLTKEESQ